MSDPDCRDDTSADYEQFEVELLAYDQDAARIATVDLDNTEACHLVSDLVDVDIVSPIPEDRVLVHESSSDAFESIIPLAVFH